MSHKIALDILFGFRENKLSSEALLVTVCYKNCIDLYFIVSQHFDTQDDYILTL